MGRLIPHTPHTKIVPRTSHSPPRLVHTTAIINQQKKAKFIAKFRYSKTFFLTKASVKHQVRTRTYRQSAPACEREVRGGMHQIKGSIAWRRPIASKRMAYSLRVPLEGSGGKASHRAD